MQKAKKIIFLFGFFTFLGLLVVILISIVPPKPKSACDQFLDQPLESKLLEDFCSRNLIPQDINYCSTTPQKITNRDVKQIVQSNIEVGKATIDEVDAKFGQYREYCENEFKDQKEKDHTAYYKEFGIECSYSFGHFQRTSLRYDPDTKVIRSLANVGCGGGS